MRSCNRNVGANILDTAGRVQKYAKPCATSPASQDDVISDVENSFDGQAYGTSPTKGDLTKVQTAKAWASATNITWLTTAVSVYDTCGRLKDATDVRGDHTVTAYTPATGGPITAVQTTQDPTGTQEPRQLGHREVLRARVRPAHRVRRRQQQTDRHHLRPTRPAERDLDADPL